MLSPSFAISQRAVQRLVAGDSPHQLAAGFTLGMMLGLVPKANLIAMALCVLLFSVRVNKGLAVAAAVAFSLVGTWADPFTHKVGASVLAIDSLQAVYAAIYGLPLGPWLGFHNTVVTGSLLVGAYLAYPTYWLVRAACCRMQKVAPGGEFCEPRTKRWDVHSQTKPLHGAAP
jgi:uncharacterized protein (TIGR03546 family)